MAELTLPTRACPLEINMDADTTMTDASDLSVISRLLDLPGGKSSVLFALKYIVY
jgi:hypothetical protein